MGNSHTDHEIKEDSISISPIKFGEGGNPNFAAHIKSHHSVLRGRRNFRPRVMASVRVPLRSYTVLARENKAEETSPWAIINISAPFIPHFVSEKIAAATMLMCPTEE